MPSISSPHLTRRSALAGSAVAVLGATGVAGAAATPGSTMRERAQVFLRGLSPDQRSTSTRSFDDPLRARWNFMGPRAKPGLPLERMTPPQQQAAMDLLVSGLSAEGFDKAERVMLLQDVLREQGRGPSDRNRERFSFIIFGTPSPGAAWGWRIEGHHLSLSWTLVGDEIVSVTPSSFSSDPNVVRGGRHDGLIALVHEEELARQVYADLSPANRRAALIQDQAFGNILATAGNEDRFGGTREGVALADLHPAQADLLMRLAEIYAVDHLAAPLAAEQADRVRAGDVAGVHFGWAGSDRPGEMMYYRLTGDTFLIEFASLRNQPLHLHTIRHDRERNLGVHALA